MYKADMRLLAEFLDDPGRPDGTLWFHELQGFLFTIACSPETIAPSEWLPMIGNDEDLNFTEQNDAQEILGLVMMHYNGINTRVLERSNSLPAGCVFDEECGATLMVLSFFGSRQRAISCQ